MGGVLNRVVKIYMLILIINDGEVSNMGAVVVPRSRAATAVVEPPRVLVDCSLTLQVRGEVLPED